MERTHGITKRLPLSGGDKPSTVYHTPLAEYLHRTSTTIGIGAAKPGDWAMRETQSRQVIMLLSAKFQMAATPAPTRLAIR